MIMLGLLLLAGAGAFTGLLIADNYSGTPDYTVTLLNNTVGTVNTLGAFLAGIALALILGAGLVLLRGGVRWHRRSTRRLARRDVAPAAPTGPEPREASSDAGASVLPPARPRRRFTHWPVGHH